MKSALITKFEHGDPLTDNDCWWLLKFFTEMEEGCKALGPEYNLFQNQMRHNRSAIEGYLTARELGEKLDKIRSKN